MVLMGRVSQGQGCGDGEGAGGTTGTEAVWGGSEDKVMGMESILGLGTRS